MAWVILLSAADSFACSLNNAVHRFSDGMAWNASLGQLIAAAPALDPVPEPGTVLLVGLVLVGGLPLLRRHLKTK